MHKHSIIYLKYIFISLSIFIIYYSFVIFLLPSFADPKITKYDQYHRLNNWDLKQHAIEDFDNDGQNDIISFTGCAFFSLIDPDTIPQELQCTSEGISSLVFHDKNRIGQKYIQTSKSALDLTSFSDDPPMFHSFVAKSNNVWKIFTFSRLKFFSNSIVAGKITPDLSQPNLSQFADEILYLFSNQYFILLIPLIPTIITYLLIRRHK